MLVILVVSILSIPLSIHFYNIYKDEQYKKNLTKIMIKNRHH